MQTGLSSSRDSATDAAGTRLLCDDHVMHQHPDLREVFGAVLHLMDAVHAAQQ
jgi:hypothetical protein